MAVFIAICDDNPADRKQAERLLSREKDRRLSDGDVIYYDTYGSEADMLPYFSKYDLFLIDISHSTRDGMMVATDLHNRQARGIMVLCQSELDYRSKYGDTDYVIYKEKPLYQRDFPPLIDLAKKNRMSQIPKVELRGESDTVYADPDDILYARATKYYTVIALRGDRSFHLFGNINRLRSMLSVYKQFLVIDAKTIVNMTHITSHSGFSFKMSDGAIIRYSFLNKPRLRSQYRRFVTS